MRRSPPTCSTDSNRPRHTSAIVGAVAPPIDASASAPPKNAGATYSDVAVDQPGPVERTDHLRAAFDHQLHDPPAAEFVQEVAELAVPFEAWPHASVRRRGAEHDAQRIVALDVANGQGRVVGADGSGADQDRVALGPQAVRVPAGVGAGDPLRGPVRRCGAAVERHGELAHHVGPTRASMVEIRGELRADLIGQHTDLDLETGGAEGCDPRSGDAIIGVDDADHHPANTGGDDRVGTRRSSAMVRARLERADDRAADRCGAGLGERDDLGVTPAGRLGGSDTDDDPLGRHHHGTDPRVR